MIRRSGEPRDAPVVDGSWFAAASAELTEDEKPTLTRQIWWSRCKQNGVFDSALAERIIADLVADLAVMPRVVLSDNAPSEELTRIFDVMLESPFDTARSAWDRHTQLVLRYGRSIWLFLQPENLVDKNSDFAQAVSDHGNSFVVFSPMAVTIETTASGAVVHLVHASGLAFQAKESELISCSWFDPTGAPGETTSVLKPIEDELAAVEVAQHAVWASLDNSRNQRVVLEIADGQVSIDTTGVGHSEPAATRLVKKSKASWLVGELLSRVRMTRETRTRDQRSRIPIALTKANDGSPITRTLTQPEIDGGLVAVATWAREQAAIVASVPTSQLTGEQPKYANMFATRDQFVRSTAGAVAFHVADAAMPAIRRWRKSAGIETKLVLELDPGALIEQTPTPATITAPVVEQISAANTKTANSILGPGVVRKLNRWQIETIKDLERLAALIAAEQDQASPIAAGVSDNIERLIERLVGRVTQLRRLVNPKQQPSDVDRANIEKAIIANVERATAAGAGSTPFTVKAIRDSLASDLFGVSRISTESNPTLMDRGFVTEVFPGLDATGGEPVEWEWSWTPPGDPDRTPFQDHLDLHGQQWLEGDEQPGIPGGDANGENCQCVIELAIPVEAAVG